MNTQFETTYPASAGLLKLAAAEIKIFAAKGLTAASVLTGEIALLPSVIAYIPSAPALKDEIAKIKASASDMEAAGEDFVTDLAFSSPQAQEAVQLSFEVAEIAISLIAPIQKIVAITHK